MPAPGARPGIGDRPGRPGGRPSTRPRPADRPINVNRPQINQRISNRYASVATRPFTPGWWGRHPVNLPARPWHLWHSRGWYSRPHYWWRWATASALTGWAVWGWTTPAYYVYGTGGNVYYENSVVYVDGQQYCTEQEYYQQAEDIAVGVPEIDEAQAQQVEWLPLGVFALTKEGINESNFLLQLAVSKEGVIGGTLVNEETGSVRPVEGMVDKETQRAAWKLIDGKNAEVVMEAGIYGLTEDECTALVHHGPDQTQTIVMVRLDEPDDPAAAAPPGQPAP
ncbi:MAG TPA: hypothetical protein VMY37_11930 [Thermoguttaceae bacterium]|nr:hypothetical protein [Thermoguttaceae bacterium]